MTLLSEVSGGRNRLLKGFESCTEEFGGVLNSDPIENALCCSRNHLTQQNTWDSKHMASTESFAIDKPGTLRQPPTMSTMTVKTLSTQSLVRHRHLNRYLWLQVQQQRCFDGFENRLKCSNRHSPSTARPGTGLPGNC